MLINSVYPICENHDSLFFQLTFSLKMVRYAPLMRS